jgi:hypothetical protein
MTVSGGGVLPSKGVSRLGIVGPAHLEIDVTKLLRFTEPAPERAKLDASRSEIEQVRRDRMAGQLVSVADRGDAAAER